MQRGEQGGIGGDDAVAHDLQPAADVGERAAQLVGDVADHGLALGLQALAALGQVVERLGEDAGLVPGGHRHPHVQFGRLLCGRGQRAQGPYEPDGDDGGHGDGDGEDQSGRTDHLGLVGRGHVEAGGILVTDAEEQLGHRGDIGLQLGAAGAEHTALLGLRGGLDVACLRVLGEQIAGAQGILSAGVEGEVQRTAEVDARLLQAGAGQPCEVGQGPLFGRGGDVQLSVRAALGGVGGVGALRAAEHGTSARGPHHGGVDAEPLVARPALGGERVQPVPLLRRDPVRADDPRVDAAELGPGLGVGVGAQGVDGGGGPGRQWGAARRGVGDQGAVGAGEGDPPTGLVGQVVDGAPDVRPVGVGGRVAAEPGQDAVVGGEVLALLLLEGAGGGRHREPGGGRDRADGDERRDGQQPDEQPFAQRCPALHGRAPLSL